MPNDSVCLLECNSEKNARRCDGIWRSSPLNSLSRRALIFSVTYDAFYWCFLFLKCSIRFDICPCLRCLPDFYYVCHMSFILVPEQKLTVCPASPAASLFVKQHLYVAAALASWWPVEGTIGQTRNASLSSRTSLQPVRPPRAFSSVGSTLHTLAILWVLIRRSRRLNRDIRPSGRIRLNTEFNN